MLKKILYMLFFLAIIASFITWLNSKYELLSEINKPNELRMDVSEKQEVITPDKQEVRRNRYLYEQKLRDQYEKEYPPRAEAQSSSQPRPKVQYKIKYPSRPETQSSGDKSSKPGNSNRIIHFDDYLQQNDAKIQADFKKETNQLIENFDKANIAFNVPNSVMNLNEKMVINLILDLKKTENELSKILDERKKSQKILSESGIAVSEVMEAKLIGSAFEINTITPERQKIDEEEITEWRWEIKAVEEGSHSLFLQLNAIITLDDEKETRSIKTFEKEIVVGVSILSKISGFFGEYWQWLWTAILIPVVSWTINRLKKKK